MVERPEVEFVAFLTANTGRLNTIRAPGCDSKTMDVRLRPSSKYTIRAVHADCGPAAAIRSLRAKMSATMKLNMGCSYNKLPGYINVDNFVGCNPDQVCDLEKFPWPWESNGVEAVLFNHCLEHLGHEPHVFLGIFRELYRVCRNDAIVEINVPHPRHDSYLGDPTHVRAVTVPMLQLFDRRLNRKWIEANSANTPLAIQIEVDFAIEGITYTLDEPYSSNFRNGQLTQPELETALREKNNIASEIRVKLRVRKPAD